MEEAFDHPESMAETLAEEAETLKHKFVDMVMLPLFDPETGQFDSSRADRVTDNPTPENEMSEIGFMSSSRDRGHKVTRAVSIGPQTLSHYKIVRRWEMEDDIGLERKWFHDPNAKGGHSPRGSMINWNAPEVMQYSPQESTPSQQGSSEASEGTDSASSRESRAFFDYTPIMKLVAQRMRSELHSDLGEKDLIVAIVPNLSGVGAN